jgi:hypothetical protein
MTRIIEHREDAVAARRCSSCGFFNCGTLTCAPASFPPTCP